MCEEDENLKRLTQNIAAMGMYVLNI